MPDGEPSGDAEAGEMLDADAVGDAEAGKMLDGEAAGDAEAGEMPDGEAVEMLDARAAGDAEAAIVASNNVKRDLIRFIIYPIFISFRMQLTIVFDDYPISEKLTNGDGDGFIDLGAATSET